MRSNWEKDFKLLQINKQTKKITNSCCHGLCKVHDLCQLLVFSWITHLPLIRGQHYLLKTEHVLNSSKESTLMIPSGQLQSVSKPFHTCNVFLKNTIAVRSKLELWFSEPAILCFKNWDHLHTTTVSGYMLFVDQPHKEHSNLWTFPRATHKLLSSHLLHRNSVLLFSCSSTSPN